MSGAASTGRGRGIAAKRSAWAAAIFSIVTPGLGQLYNGFPLRAAGAAALIVAIQALILLASLVPPETPATGYMQFGLRGAGLLLVLAILVDAVVGARRAGKIELRRFNLPAVYLLVLAAWMAEQQGVNHLERHITASAFYDVPAGSMEPTLASGDFIFAYKGYYRSNAVARGEVVAYREPGDGSHLYLLRVIGLPGDRVGIENGVPLLNGKAAMHGETGPDVPPPAGTQPALPVRTESLPDGVSYEVSEQSGAAGNADNRLETDVPDGYVFLLGDNRNKAMDSRKFGTVPIEDLESRLTFIGWSDDRSRIGRQVQPGR